MLDLLKSYITNLEQIVQYNGQLSSELKLLTGVPQGSILGPLLFLIYINDIVNVSKVAKLLLFADDTTSLYTGPTLDILFPIINKDLRDIHLWCNINKISLNYNKTKYMIFSPTNRPKKWTCKCHQLFYI